MLLPYNNTGQNDGDCTLFYNLLSFVWGAYETAARLHERLYPHNVDQRKANPLVRLYEI